MNGWTQVSCEERERIYKAARPRPSASLTDLSGRYGDPQIFTEWADANEAPVLRDYRWPNAEDGKPDARPCQHWIPEATS